MSETEKRTPWHDMRDGLVRRYGEPVGTFLATRIGKAIRQCGADECLSHFRVAELSNPEEVARFWELHEAGCCAWFEGELEFNGPEPRRFRFGFNWGH